MRKPQSSKDIREDSEGRLEEGADVWSLLFVDQVMSDDARGVCCR